MIKKILLLLVVVLGLSSCRTAVVVSPSEPAVVMPPEIKDPNEIRADVPIVPAKPIEKADR